MRHFFANLAVYVLAGALLLLSVIFAWIRSEQVVLATEGAIESPRHAEVSHPQDFPWEEIGERVYVANCAACHAIDGTGRETYPPVTGQSEVFLAPGGREYLIHVMLYGLWTRQHRAPMPPMPNLSDVQIAAVNNYILTRFDNIERIPGDVPLYIPAEVAAERGRAWRERDVGPRRPDVPLPADLRAAP